MKRHLICPHKSDHDLEDPNSDISMVKYKEVRMQCRHNSHTRLLRQQQNNINYKIMACEICAEIALRSCGGGFTEIYLDSAKNRDIKVRMEGRVEA